MRSIRSMEIITASVCGWAIRFTLAVVAAGPRNIWAGRPNKEFPAKVDLKAKTITVKGPADQPVELTITGKKIVK